MKIYAIVITFILAVSILVLTSCGTPENSSIDTTYEPADTTEPVESDEESYNILDDLTLDEAISLYINRVRTLAEENKVQNTGDSEYFVMTIGDYEFETRNTGDVEVLYRDESGFKNAKYFNLHLPMNMDYYYEIVTNPNESIVIQGNEYQLYRWGEKLNSVTLPENYIYCGHTAWGCAVIRAEDTVYIVDTVSLNKVASGVRYVISTEYELSSDAWDSILFLMEDGSLKAFVSWQEGLQDLGFLDGCEGEWYSVHRPLSW